ncbi:hypothetical protein R1sor_006048 [Riccia sorocarpa]|uniref:Uncharacterized protein n=1 Tax=Riccia sorocarpa TaxID=122646 RepID=A0ABD3HPU4_9MARC
MHTSRCPKSGRMKMTIETTSYPSNPHRVLVRVINDALSRGRRKLGMSKRTLQNRIEKTYRCRLGTRFEKELTKSLKRMVRSGYLSKADAINHVVVVAVNAQAAHAVVHLTVGSAAARLVAVLGRDRGPGPARDRVPGRDRSVLVVEVEAAAAVVIGGEVVRVVGGEEHEGEGRPRGGVARIPVARSLTHQEVEIHVLESLSVRDKEEKTYSIHAAFEIDLQLHHPSPESDSSSPPPGAETRRQERHVPGRNCACEQ